MINQEIFEPYSVENSVTIGVLRPRAGGRRTHSVAELLFDSSSRLRVSRGGHLPDEVVLNFVQQNYTSDRSICESFATTAHRICMFDLEERLLSTVLVSRDPERALVVDSSNINVPISVAGLPPTWHQVFNFATSFHQRRKGHGRHLLQWILRNHERLELAGQGIWTFVEPPDRAVYLSLGFRHLPSCDLYLHLPGTDNTEYNNLFRHDADRQEMRAPDFKLKCFLMTKEWT
jgi:GNAT superfamily N-acetyltransferase